MDCEGFERVVLDRLYLELDEQSMGAAQRHVAHCSRCRGIEAGLKATRDVCRLPLLPLPATFKDQVIASERSIRAVLPLRQRASRAVSVLAGYAMRPQLTMAALLLLMIGASLFLVRSPPPDRDLVQVTERGVQEGEIDPHRAKAHPSINPGMDTLQPLAAPSHTRTNSKAEACPANEPGCAIAADGKEQNAAPNSDREPTLEAEYRTARQLQFSSGCSVAIHSFDAIRRRQPKSEVGLAATWQAADCYAKLNRREEARTLLNALLDSPEYSQRARTQLKALGEM